jgi:hypothetical protein
VSDLPLSNRYDQFLMQFIYRVGGLMLLILTMFVAIQAQVATSSPTETPYLVQGVSDTMAYGLGRSVKITGTVKNGAIALGGDVIVEGTVEGDVAAIGGSVIQLEGSRIGGDVIVIGGSYQPGRVPNRAASSTTIMYAGYEQAQHDAQPHRDDQASVVCPVCRFAPPGCAVLVCRLSCFDGSLARND